MRASPSALIVAAVLGIAALPVSATVDTLAPPPIRVRGTLLPEGESDLLRFRAVAGTVLDVSVTGSPGLALDVGILDADEVPVDPGDARILDTGARFSAKGLVLPSTGAYALRLSGQGTGEYRLTAAAKAPARFAWKGVDLGAPEPLSLDLAALAGSRLTIQAKPSRGSPALPRVLGLASDAFSLDLREEGLLRNGSHKVTIQSLPATGDCILAIGNDSDQPGPIDVLVAVRAPKASPTTLDLRAGTLGQPSGGETWITRAVRSTDDGAVFEEDGACGCAGAGVFVPGTAWAGEVRVDLVSAPDLPLPGADWIPVGPAVRFMASAAGPPGATLHLPFDSSLIPANRPPEEIRVLARTGDGAAALLPPATGALDGESLVVTSTGGLPVDRTLQPVVLRGTPRMDARYWGFEARVEWEPDFQDDQSASRHAGFTVLDIDFLPDGTFTVGMDRRGVSFGSDPSGVGTVTPDVATGVGSGTWSYEADGRAILARQTGDEGARRMEVSASGAAFAGSGLSGGGPSSILFFGLRKPAVRPTPASLAGAWGVCMIGYGARNGGDGGRPELRLSRLTGRIVLEPDGTLSITVKQRDFQTMSTGWRTSAASMSYRGTFAVQEDGSVLLQIPGSEGPGALRLMPGADGRAGLFVLESRDASDQILGVAVRESSGAEVAGEQVLRSLNVGPGSFTGPGSLFIPDVVGGTMESSLTPTGGGKAAGSGVEHHVWRDPGVPGGVAVEDGSVEFTVGMALDARGGLTVTDPQGAKLRGFLAEGGEFGVFVDDPGSAKEDTAFGVFFPVARPGN